MKIWGPLLKIGESQYSNNRALKQAEAPLSTGPCRAAQATPWGRPWPASRGLSQEGPEPWGLTCPWRRCVGEALYANRHPDAMGSAQGQEALADDTCVPLFKPVLP